MKFLRTYYEVMGLPKTATQAEVKARYHDLARQFHPDRAKDKVLAQRHFTQINLAYRTLSDAQKRATYDGSLNNNSVSTGANNTAPASPGVGHRSPQPKTDPVRGPKTEPIPHTQPIHKPAMPQQGQLTVEKALEKANSHYMGGDRRAAQQLCLNIIRADARNASAHVLLGDIYSDLGQRVEALQEYRTAAGVGDASMLLQGKIKRLETQSSTPVRPVQSSSSGQRPPPTPPAAPPQTRAPDPPKKGNLFDKLIGRGK